MTADPKKAELERQALMLETPCRQLLLRPQDALAREHLGERSRQRHWRRKPRAAPRCAPWSTRCRLALSLAFRLESAGYTGLYPSAATAMLCQALVQLRMQLTAIDAETLGIRLPGEIASPV